MFAIVQTLLRKMWRNLSPLLFFLVVKKNSLCLYMPRAIFDSRYAPSNRVKILLSKLSTDCRENEARPMEPQNSGGLASHTKAVCVWALNLVGVRGRSKSHGRHVKKQTRTDTLSRVATSLTGVLL